MSGPGIAIIADDLTGALDASAPFARAPGGVAVATRPDAMAAALDTGASVVAVSTRSREVPAAEARARVDAVLAQLPAGARIVKKIDSRLKGNIAAELAPLADRPMVVLPAIPDFGRIVRDGALQGFGVETPIPVRAALGKPGAAARVPDTDDSAQMLQAVAEAPADAVLVGARGLAQALAAHLGLPGAPVTTALPPPVCFLVGSTDPITLAQVAALRAARSDLHHIAAPGGDVPEGEAPARHSLIQAVPGAAETRPERVAAALASGALPHLRAARSMLLTGGATAEAALDSLEIALLIVDGEALPGMALCRAGAQVVVTKSGGFGAPDAFVRLARAPADTEV